MKLHCDSATPQQVFTQTIFNYIFFMTDIHFILMYFGFRSKDTLADLSHLLANAGLFRCGAADLIADFFWKSFYYPYGELSVHSSPFQDDMTNCSIKTSCNNSFQDIPLSFSLIIHLSHLSFELNLSDS